MYKNKRATVIIYALFLTSLALVMAVLVQNNLTTIFLSWESGDINSKLKNNIVTKINLSIDLDKYLNTTWSWFIDDLKCPTDIYMSWSTTNWTISTSTLTYTWGTYYCLWDSLYSWKELKLYFNSESTEYGSGEYDSSFITITSWSWDSAFWDSDSTLIDFSWNYSASDNIDDNFDSDNYRWNSTWSIDYPDSYSDNDDEARKNIYWYVFDTDGFYNIFWSNTPIKNIIWENTNNTGSLTINMWNTSTWYLFLDLDKDFNIKLAKYSSAYYDSNNKLKPDEFLETNSLSSWSWYIQNNLWVLSLSWVITWNEYVFDFINSDYWVFIENSLTWALLYRVFWEEDTWSWLYINPIDDSWSWTIKILWNDIIIFDDLNHIGKTLEVIKSK